MDELTVSRNVTARLIIIIRETCRGRGCERSLGEGGQRGTFFFFVERASHPSFVIAICLVAKRSVFSPRFFFVRPEFTRG